MATLKIKIIPSSSCDCITGWLDDILKIKVMAPPEKNKANKSALKKLSQWINVPIKNISIKNGTTNQYKTTQFARRLSENSGFRQIKA